MKTLIYIPKSKPYLVHHPYECKPVIWDDIKYDDDIYGRGFENELFKYNGKVVASFEFDEWDIIECDSEQHKSILDKSCLTLDQIIDYCNGQDFYAWHIKDLKVFEEPMWLGELTKWNREDKWFPDMNFIPITHAPRNYQYVYYKGEKCLLVSIRAEHVINILNGKKTLEIRKSVPRLVKEGRE